MRIGTRSTITAKREYVLIYDLGGGTFDASLLKMTGHVSEVVVSEGIQRLGGDDFDEAIVNLGRQRIEPAGAGRRQSRLAARGVRRPQGGGRATDPPLPGGPHRSHRP